MRGYERFGEDLLDQLRGIYALVLWDGDRDTLIAARDRTGARTTGGALRPAACGWHAGRCRSSAPLQG